jgi:hypothetical protein
VAKATSFFFFYSPSAKADGNRYLKNELKAFQSLFNPLRGCGMVTILATGLQPGAIIVEPLPGVPVVGGVST